MLFVTVLCTASLLYASPLLHTEKYYNIRNTASIRGVALHQASPLFTLHRSFTQHRCSIRNIPLHTEHHCSIHSIAAPSPLLYYTTPLRSIAVPNAVFPLHTEHRYFTYHHQCIQNTTTLRHSKSHHISGSSKHNKIPLSTSHPSSPVLPLYSRLRRHGPNSPLEPRFLHRSRAINLSPVSTSLVIYLPLHVPRTTRPYTYPPPTHHATRLWVLAHPLPARASPDTAIYLPAPHKPCHPL